ncbi:MAG: hypothetical protein MJZ67_06945 [Bacteroidales bacterium]|nr:hypothetical protein [Bacteroidales bacterium]
MEKDKTGQIWRLGAIQKRYSYGAKARPWPMPCKAQYHLHGKKMCGNKKKCVFLQMKLNRICKHLMIE